MFHNQHSQAQKTSYALFGIVLATIMVIITISILSINLAPRQEANIVNPTSPSSAPNTIPESDLTRLRQALFSLLETTYSVSRPFDASIRWNTLEKQAGDPAYSFLVDVDEYQQTYRATMTDNFVMLDCPSISESKYPESFCIGNFGENNDSIYTVFGDQLPYVGQTSSGESFTISRNDISSMQNLSDRYLLVHAYLCPWDDAAEARVGEAVDDYITSLGASPELFDIRILSASGCHTE